VESGCSKHVADSDYVEGDVGALVVASVMVQSSPLSGVKWHGCGAV
jgi:hypothetical protein